MPKRVNSKTNKKSYLIIVISILSVIIIILSIFVGMNLDMIKNKSSIIEKDEPICSFELMDVKKYQGFYETSLFFREDPMAYIVYEGLIKNNSNKKEFLKEMILQLYNEKDIFLGEGYDDINKYIEPGKSMPFKLLAKINRTNDTVLRKYYDESKELVPDIYPWFLTCK